MHASPFSRQKFRWQAAALLALSGALSACNDKDTLPADDHDHEPVETSGRLVFGEANAARAHVYDLDDARILQSFTLDFPANAIYASPERRYAVVLSRSNDRTQFVDAGIWQEDHGDHLHDYREDPLLLALKFDGARPTHYETHDGLAALFFDGNAAAAQNASVAVLSDASLENGGSVATLTLPVAMHGTAEPRGEHLLTTHREADAEGTLPGAVDLYQREGSGYRHLRRIEPGCPGLHGSFSSDDYSVFGCSDGVLAVTGDDFTAVKIANPAGLAAGARIGTLVGHHELAGFGGFAGSEFYAIDVAARSMTRVDWSDGAAVSKLAHAMDAHGENFLILDSAGTLHLLDPAQNWAHRASLAVIGAVAEGQVPVIAVSHAAEQAFITDPGARQIVVVDLAEARIIQRITLDFVPVGLSWQGLSEHAH